MTTTTQEAHNQGQTDRSQGNGHNPPHGTWDHVTAVTTERNAEITANNTAYNQGYEHAREQDSK
jgi:hypothetical protein